MHSRQSAGSLLLAAVLAIGVAGTAIASTSSASGTPTRIVDNETVYVIADAAGTPKQTVVVDWWQVEGSGSFEIADPAASVESIESLTDGFEPKLARGDVVATIEQEGHGDYFYRANTTAELPLEITLTYYFDGNEIAPAELAGKSGRLAIEIEMHNNLAREETVAYEDADGTERSAEITYTVPLLAIPQIELDGTKMTNIDPPAEAQLAIAGSTQTYAIPMFPSPDASARIEMDARDIELEPLVISVLPVMPSSADFSIQEELAEMRDGLSKLQQLSEGHLKVVEGITDSMGALDTADAGKAAEGFAQLETALGKLASGANDLAKLSAGQYAYLDGVIKSIDPDDFDALLELPKAIGQMADAAGELEGGVKGLVTLIDGQIAIAVQLEQSNSQLLSAARDLELAYPGDANVTALANGLAQQQAVIDALLDGGDLGSGYVPGLRYTREQLAGIGGGLAQLHDGLVRLERESAALEAVPDAFEQIRGALVVLRDGGKVQGTYLPGLDTTTSGLKELAGGLTQASSGLSGSSEQLDMLSELPKLLGTLKSTLTALATGGTVQGTQLPGISTTVEGLGQVTDGLGTAVNALGKGKAKVDAMKRAADEYSSFLGTPKDAEGQLTFLFKLEGVKKE